MSPGKSPQRPRIGLALGSGSARGWSHIGVIRKLLEFGIVPDMVAGTSIGALVGGAWVSGNLDPLENWVRGLQRADILRLMDARLSGGGFLRGERLMDAISEHVENPDLSDLQPPFAAVATDLDTGRELWLRSGPMLDAVRASIALPGLFAPVHLEGRWLMDGGLVNPVPVSLCRAMGAEVVIAVNLNGDIVGRHFSPRPAGTDPKETSTNKSGSTSDADVSEDNDSLRQLFERLRSGFGTHLDSLISSLAQRKETAEPGLFDVLAGSINIVQDRLTRSRMAGDPPEVVITPRLSSIRLMEFDRAAEAIEGGIEAVSRAREDLEDVMER